MLHFKSIKLQCMTSLLQEMQKFLRKRMRIQKNLQVKHYPVSFHLSGHYLAFQTVSSLWKQSKGSVYISIMFTKAQTYIYVYAYCLHCFIVNAVCLYMYACCLCPTLKLIRKRLAVCLSVKLCRSYVLKMTLCLSLF